MQTIKRQAFDTLDDKQLIWACIEPTINEIRGRDYAAKAKEYTKLNPGQRALLAVQVIYGHTTSGAMEFYNHLAYLLPHPGVWSMLKSGAQYFGDDSLLHLLSEMEAFYRQIEKGIRTDAPELEAIINQLDKSLNKQMPLTIQTAAAYIRSHPAEYVLLED